MTTVQNKANAVGFSLLLAIKAIFMAEGVRRLISEGEYMPSPNKMQRHIKIEMLQVLESTDSAEEQGKLLAEKGMVLGFLHDGKFNFFPEVEIECVRIKKELEEEINIPYDLIIQSLKNNFMAVYASFPDEYSDSLEWAQLQVEDSLKVVPPTVEEVIEETAEQAIETNPQMNSEFETITEEAAPEGTDTEGDDTIVENDEIPGTSDDDTVAEIVEETIPEAVPETITETVPETAAETATETEVETPTEVEWNVTEKQPVTIIVADAAVENATGTDFDTAPEVTKEVVVEPTVMKGHIEFAETVAAEAPKVAEPIAVAKAKELIFDSFKNLPANVVTGGPQPLPLSMINTPILTVPSENPNVEILSPERLAKVLTRIENERKATDKPFDATVETTRLMSRKPGLQISIVLTNVDGQDYKLGCSPKNFETGFCWPMIDLIDSNKTVLTVPAILNFTATSYKGETAEKATLSGIGETDGDVCVGYIPVVIEESYQTTASVIKMLREGYEFVATARATTRDGKFYNFWKAPNHKVVELKFQNPTPHYVKGVVGTLPI